MNLSDKRILATFIIVFISCCTEKKPEQSPLPSALEFSDFSRINPEWVSGVYADRWVGEQAEIVLANPGHSRVLELIGINPGVKSLEDKLEISLSSSGETFFVVRISSPGDFRELASLPVELAASDTLQFELTSSKSFVPSALGTSDDDRVLSFQVQKIAIVPDADAAVLFPESYTFPRGPESDPNLEGIYKDGWMGDSAKVTLYNSMKRKELDIRGFFPMNVFKRITDLEVRIGGKLLVKEQLTRKNQGYFRVLVQLPDEYASTGEITVSIRPAVTFVPVELGINEDTRRISYRLEYIGFR